MTAKCTYQQLVEAVNYDSETGVFTRIKPGRGVPRPGSVVGCVNGRGYLIAMISRRIYLLHQLAWFYVHGEWADQIDHANGDKSDNRISNLRPATHSQNNANKPLTKSNTTRFKGVSWTAHAKKFRASIKVNRKTIHLGYRDSPSDAHDLYREAAIKHFAEFARA